MTHRIACIDIGTYTVRLGVADVVEGAIVRMAKQSTICNLGDRLYETGSLQLDAMQRVYACVRQYQEAARNAQAEVVCCTLTAAAREADNASELGAALASLGLDPIVIPGEVEAALTFLGVARDFPGESLLVVDSGGGSTELAQGVWDPREGVQLSRQISLPLGCRRITDVCGLAHDQALTEEELDQARAYIRQVLREQCVETLFGQSSLSQHVLCCGGTATSLAAVQQRLVQYDPKLIHHARLDRSELDRLITTLAACTETERAQTPGLQSQRAGVIVAGGLILHTLAEHLAIPELMVSESDLLFGLSTALYHFYVNKKTLLSWIPTYTEIR